MASSRRALSSGFSHLSRRLRPSFAHFLLLDRDDSSPRSPSPIPNRSYSSSRFLYGISSPSQDQPGLGFSIPFDLALGRRNYSSSTEGSSEIDVIKDVAGVLSDTTFDAAAVAASAVPAPFPGEVAAAAADSFLPVAALQYLIDGVHSVTGFSWWASIALTTVLIRSATIPLLLNQMRATVKLNMMRPELEELKEQMQNSMDPQSVHEGQKKMKALFKKYGVTPFTPLKGIFIQGPIFVSFFLAISNMVEKVPSFKGGGISWFTDLTTPDPFYVLPVLTAATFLATVELNMQEGMEGNPMANTMKNFSRVLALFTVPFTATFPKAIFFYWVTSNVYSLLYGFVIKRPPVRKFLNLPDIVPQPTPTKQPNFNFFGGLKSISTMDSPSPIQQAEEHKSSDRKISSSSVISQRIRNLEKTVKSRRKPKRR
ncbi:putative membrane insertase YidC/ALB3/OXA1/COX18, membrane insertase YidC/Oxa1 [Dioscorea sansibarensis]